MINICVYYRQIVPVVKYGTFEEIKKACIQNSNLWKYFQVRSLRVNMRLERLRQRLLQQIQTIHLSVQTANDQGNAVLIQSLTEQKETLISDEIGQRSYAQMILQIGNGNVTDSERLSFNKSDPVNYSTTYNFRTNNCFILKDKMENESVKVFETRSQNTKSEALQQFYPNGFQTQKMKSKTILAATNKQVDEWNYIIQKMNPNYSDVPPTQKCKSYFSSDKLNAVDDPRDIISDMLSEEMLNKFNSDKSPPHILTLCVGDICYLMRTLGKKSK